MNRTLAIPAILATALAAGLIIFFAFSPGRVPASPPGGTPGTITPTLAGPTPSSPGPFEPVPLSSATPARTPALTTAPTGGSIPSGIPSITLAVTSTPPTVSGPPRFVLIVTPVEARAAPGSTIVYTMVIEPRAGFDQPISLRLDVSALFLYRNSFDLGTVIPPYPKTIEYRFRVPPDVPSGITVKGVLSAEGGGQREEQDLVLLVGG